MQMLRAGSGFLVLASLSVTASGCWLKNSDRTTPAIHPSKQKDGGPEGAKLTPEEQDFLKGSLLPKPEFAFLDGQWKLASKPSYLLSLNRAKQAFVQEEQVPAPNQGREDAEAVQCGIRDQGLYSVTPTTPERKKWYKDQGKKVPEITVNLWVQQQTLLSESEKEPRCQALLPQTSQATQDKPQRLTYSFEINKKGLTGMADALSDEPFIRQTDPTNPTQGTSQACSGYQCTLVFYDSDEITYHELESVPFDQPAPKVGQAHEWSSGCIIRSNRVSYEIFKYKDREYKLKYTITAGSESTFSYWLLSREKQGDRRILKSKPLTPDASTSVDAADESFWVRASCTAPPAPADKNK